MRRVSHKFAILIRPQLIVGVFVAGIMLFGFLLPSPSKPSAQTFTQPAVAHAVATYPMLPPAPILPSPVDCSVQACLALTFDDGPSANVTPRILATLEQHNVHATFFVVGSHVPGNEGLLRRMYQDGDEIGNHSWNHANFTKLPVDQIEQQFVRTQAAVSAAGVPAPTLFRPPYGAVNAVVTAHVPLTMAMWNIDPEDWRAKIPQEIIDKVKANSRPGRVILLHDTHNMTADALNTLIAELQTQYHLVTFTELFNLAPGQPGMFYGR